MMKMLINIKMMTREAYSTLQKNYKDVYEQVKSHPSDSTWLEMFLGFYPYEVKKYLIEDFELKDFEDYKNIAFENGIILYEHLKNLPRYILCDCRFWAWITFEKAYKQALHTIKMKNASALKNILLGTNARRSLMLSAISQFYFRIECSVDEARDNKYELSKYLFDYYELYRCIVDRNMGMLKSVNLALIRAIIDTNEKFQFKFDIATIRLIGKDMLRIGSVMLIDHMSQDEIYSILYNKIKRRFSFNLLNKES